MAHCSREKMLLAGKCRNEPNASIAAFSNIWGQACVQALLLAHALLHHPQAWPRQETALGLLISLRKFYNCVRVRASAWWVSRRLCCCQPTALVCSVSLCICPDTMSYHKLCCVANCQLALLCCADNISSGH